MSTVFEASYTALKKAEAKRDFFRLALAKYGMHLADCPRNGSDDPADKCNCGFEKALAK